MSAINVIVQRDAAHLITDAAVYDNDGIVRQIRPKTYVLPHLKCAIATRGPSRSTDLLGFAMATLFSSFEDLVEQIEEQLPAIIELHADELTGGGNTRVDLFIVGWSEHGPAAYFIQTEPNGWVGDTEILNPPAYTLTPLPSIVASPCFTPEAGTASMEGANRVIRDVDDLDASMDGLRMLEIQRRDRCALVPGGPEAHWVGGFGLWTRIGEHSVGQSVITRWNDRIGEPITPEAMDWAAWNRKFVPEVPSQLSRHERRALERQQRKGRIRVV
jgi:hypothetical protein